MRIFLKKKKNIPTSIPYAKIGIKCEKLYYSIYEVIDIRLFTLAAIKYSLEFEIIDDIDL